jgi:tetratricopeptide (TPR) repeat protein
MSVSAYVSLALVGIVPGAAQSPEALLAQANTALEAKDSAKALELAERLLKTDSRNPEAFAVRGQALRLQKDFQGSLAAYSRAIELNPAAHRAFGGRALTRLALKAPDEALRDVEKALAMQQDYSRGWTIKGDILIDQNQHKEALQAYERSLKLDPTYPSALHGRARCKANLGDPAGAVEDYDQLLRINPAEVFALYSRALSREALKDTAGAAEDYSACIEKGHRVAEANFRRGLARKALGDTRGARQDWNRALELDPKLTVAKDRLGELGPAKLDPPAERILPATVRSGAIPGLATKVPVLPRPTGELWSKASTDQVKLASQGPALVLGNADPGTALRALPLAGFEYAQEALKSLSGPLSPDQERQWGKKWQPFFDFPDPEALAYFQKLNPVLAELQTVRATAHQAAQDFDAAWSEAVLSHAVGDAEGAVSALGQAERHAQVLQSGNAKLEDLQRRAQALGNPPDPVAAKAKARAWSRKWTGGLSELAKLSYLWRVSQLYNKNLDGRMAANYTAIWPGTEEAWGQWLDGGKQGPEPRGPEPSKETLQKAGAWMNPVYDVAGIGPCLRIHFAQNVLPEVAAKHVLEKGKVSPWRLPGFVHIMGEPCHLCENQAAGGMPPPKTPVETVPTKQAKDEAELKAKQESIAEKEDLIRLIQRNLARDEAEWSKERDSNRKEVLYLRVLNNRSAIQQERDLVTSLKTGEYVHTRTPSDAYCHDLMIVRTVERMQAVEDTRRMAVAVEKMAAKAEPDQVKQLLAFVGRQITAKDLAEGNLGKARQAAQAVFDTVQGRREQQAAKALQDAVDYEDYELRAQRVKSIAAVTLLVTGIAAPAYAVGSGTLLSVGGSSQGAVTAVNVFYGATTGTIDGGPLEGVKQAVAMTGMPGMVAAEMMTGYQRGGLVSSGGVVGALERGTEAFLAGKAVESVASKLGAWWVGKAKGGSPPLPAAKPGVTVKEFVEGQTFQLAKNQAQNRIRQYRDTVNQIKAARSKGADTAELAALEAKRLKQATQLNDDFLAKRILKADGKAGRAGRGPATGTELEGDFAKAVDTLHRTQVDPAFRKAVKDAGYQWKKRTPGGWQKAGDPKFKDMRHGDAGKTLNSDRDLALEEMAGKDDGVYQLFKCDKPISLNEAEKDLQQLYNQAYKGATGGNPQAAMQNITTSRSGEAYKDLAYTGMTDPANVARVKKGWAEQASEVLTTKVSHAGAGQGDFSTLYKQINGANQAAKDIEKRLLPVLQANRAKATGQKAFEVGQDMDKWKAIQRVLEEVEKDPVGASRKLKVLTGLESIGEVSDLVSKRFLGGMKLQ